MQNSRSNKKGTLKRSSSGKKLEVVGESKNEDETIKNETTLLGEEKKMINENVHAATQVTLNNTPTKNVVSKSLEGSGESDYVLIVDVASKNGVIKGGSLKNQEDNKMKIDDDEMVEPTILERATTLATVKVYIEAINRSADEVSSLGKNKNSFFLEDYKKQ